MTELLPDPVLRELIETRRDLHMHPELAFEEVRTAGIAADRLQALGLEVRTGVAKTGVVGLLRGAEDGPCLLVRADMDCLPVDEENDVPYRSRVPGRMHACGHDGHTGVALAVARMMAMRRDHLPGTVKFVFQPAEETLGGAAPMIAEGVLEDPRVDACLGLHLWNELPVGQIGVLDGPAMAATGGWTCVIRGKGGHGASPHETVDPIVAASHAIAALQSIVSRNLSPLESGVVTVGSYHAGRTANVIPNEAVLEGTIRSFQEKVHTLLEHRAREVFTRTAEAFGAEADWQYSAGYPVLRNDPAMCDLVRAAAADAVGAGNVVVPPATLGGEDMAYFLRERPGCFFFVGSAATDGAEVFPHHSPRFNIDEASLPIAARAMLGAVERFFGLEPWSGPGPKNG